MDQYKSLAKNTLVFFIANFGSKILNLVIVPLYTYMLTSEEYGTADLITTIVGLLLPALTLVIYDVGMRFAMDDENDNIGVLTECIHIFSYSLIVLLLIMPIIVLFPNLKQYGVYLYFVYLFSGLNQIFTQFAKGIGKIVEFSISGVLYTIVFLASNIILLVIAKLKIEGYLLSYIIAYVISCFYIIIKCKLWKYIKINKNYNRIRNQLIKYGAPLVLNSIIWWVIISSDKLFLSYICGNSSNGIYAVAYKIPSILTMIGTIFMQAWTISSIETNNSKNKEEFYNSIFKLFSFIIIIIFLALLILSKLVLKLVIAKEYFEASNYIPILLWVSIFSLFAQFWSAFYLAEKNTSNLAKSSIIAGILNLILNYFLIGKYSIYGATIASAIACMVMWICRIYGIKNKIKIKFTKKVILEFILSILATYIYYLETNMKYVLFAILIGVVLFINRELLISLFNESRKQILKKMNLN